MELKHIDINNQLNVKVLTFPDSQPHVILGDDINTGDQVKVTCVIRTTDDLFKLLELSNLLERLSVKKKVLTIPYLLCARSDRQFSDKDSFDLYVIAKLINSCEFEKVMLIDVHSDVATDMIRNSINYIPQIVDLQKIDNPLIICPDKGALLRVPPDNDVVYCDKKRDLSTGKITLKVNDPERCAERNCVIIDDLCDGGGTFLAIAEQIEPETLTLAVTHGIFSKGLGIFEGVFDKIITTNTYFQECFWMDWYEGNRVENLLEVVKIIK